MFRFFGIKIINGNLPDIKLDNVFPIRLYQKDKLYNKVNGIDVFIAGDSAFGGHYFSGSGIGYGFRMAWKLCDVILNHKDYQNYEDFIKYFMNNDFNPTIDFQFVSWEKFGNQFKLGSFNDKVKEETIEHSYAVKRPAGNINNPDMKRLNYYKIQLNKSLQILNICIDDLEFKYFYASLRYGLDKF